jgi:hypothetical protein
VAAAVAVAPVESAIAGKRLTLIEQAKGCHESMAPFCFCAQIPFRDVPCVGRGLSRCEMLCAVRGGTVRDGRPATRREMVLLTPLSSHRRGPVLVQYHFRDLW